MFRSPPGGDGAKLLHWSNAAGWSEEALPARPEGLPPGPTALAVDADGVAHVCSAGGRLDHGVQVAEGWAWEPIEDGPIASCAVAIVGDRVVVAFEGGRPRVQVAIRQAGRWSIQALRDRDGGTQPGVTLADAGEPLVSFQVGDALWLARPAAPDGVDQDCDGVLE